MYIIFSDYYKIEINQVCQIEIVILEQSNELSQCYIRNAAIIIDSKININFF